jgi:hypothetical protein
MIPLLPTHSRAEALRNAKTDNEVNSSRYRPHHGPERSSLMDHPAVEASDLRLKSRAFEDEDEVDNNTGNKEAKGVSKATGVAEANSTVEPTIACKDGLSGAGTADLAANSPTIRPSSGVGDNYSVIPVSMTNYVAPIFWKLDRDHNPLFKSTLEKETIQRNAEQAGTRHSEFWVHPVRYEPVIEEANVLRTVQIDHIPRHLGIQDVLREVCWGMIESIQLIDVGNIRGPQVLMPAPYKFARIVFHKARHATFFQRYSHNKPLTMAGQQVRVYVQMEPTYPRTAEVDEAIFARGLTRILSVFGLTGGGIDLLPAYLKSKGLDLVSLEKRDHEDATHRFESKTVMEFRSVLHAFRAFRAMENGGYEGVEMFFVEPDYCARIP